MARAKSHSKAFIEEVLNDYRIANESRQVSLLGRREVLTGKAKFGIFGDGKEVPQLAMAKVFKPGDWRAGYYRDQTFMFAAGLMTLEEFFAQLYGDTDAKFNPQTAGRLMNNHFSSRTLDEHGEWLNLAERKNISADISPTAGHMPRLLGLALASKFFRQNKELSKFNHQNKFSHQGGEVAFGTIGDASTSEGYFFEALNAAGVLKVPLAMSVWDDGYGISVSKELQTIKSSISEALRGFEKNSKSDGFIIRQARGWDYEELCRVYEEGIKICREEHLPVLFHITELTQPQGHSTSGSHERYKSKQRLEWEAAYDGLRKMREWILKENIADKKVLDDIEEAAVLRAKEARKKAWDNYMGPLKRKQKEFINMVDITTCNCAKTEKIDAIKKELKMVADPIRKDISASARKILRLICNQCSNPKNSLKENVTNWLDAELKESHVRYSSHLYTETGKPALKVEAIQPVVSKSSPWVPGRLILRDNFDHLFGKYPHLIAFGEDVGKIGGVNQTYEGLQQKYGEHRIFDTGIREATIVGQGVGLAMRGLRPIAEIQYFDYLLYALQVMSDDLATLRYRTRGAQKAPLIISTRGHRLEGIWHAGSPLSMVINSIRGMYVCVPRNMTQAAGFYNTFLEADDPALIIEPLNGYRLKEKMPDNIGEYRIPIGQCEVLHEGFDVTIVTYGSCVRIAEDAVKQLTEYSISCELIDVQTLLPFDLDQTILKSLKKTNKIVFFDEDVPGGATSYMMQKVLEEQKGYYHLDSEPRTVTAREHRAAYSTDGDYFSNPNAEDVFDAVYNLMHEYNPGKYPKIF
jgi:pyruvate/2-oxoglutarate/acetoin dehydrogenase E1 component/TPP-dependent pyruvate/acetoin dehydrogenase alpha subunit